MIKNKSYWKKIGLIYELSTEKDDYLVSHASNPTAIEIKDGVFRVYFSARDIENRSSVSAFDLDLKNYKIINEFNSPLFKFDKTSNFFPDGVSVSSIYNVENINYLTFMGWINKEDEHWRGLIGRVQLTENFLIEEKSSQILLDLNKIDKVSLSYPFIIEEDGKYKMYYGSTIEWKYKNDEMLHVINYAESTDGHNFLPLGLSIPYIDGVAQAFSRPSVIIDGNKKHAWFSYRGGNGDKYKIGYAVSDNGKVWKINLEKYQISTSVSGWDSEMVEYPFVFKYKNDLFMLYNGNGYGKTGIGLAILKEG